MTDIQESFSRWLSGQMRDRGLNYTSLADLSGVARTNVRNWEVGANLPSWHRCRDLAKALGVSPAEVRRRAGYIDPDDTEIPDERLSEIVATWIDLEEVDRTLLHCSARALRGYSRRRGQAD